MVAQWVLYAVQIRQTREVTNADSTTKAIPSLHCSLTAVAKDIFATDYPGRLMSTLAVGFSTFSFWSAFYFFKSVAKFWGTILAAVFNVTVTTPLWTIIMRMQADTSDTPATWYEQAGRIYEQRGIVGFFAGLTPNLVMITFPLLQANIYFVIVQMLVVASGEDDEVNLHAKYKYIASLTAGFSTLTAVVATYPIQFARVRWQTGMPVLPDGACASASACEVVNAVYAGIWTKLLQSAFLLHR